MGPDREGAGAPGRALRLLLEHWAVHPTPGSPHPNERGSLLLNVACTHGALETARYLLNNQPALASLHARSANGYTPIPEAAASLVACALDEQVRQVNASAPCGLLWELSEGSSARGAVRTARPGVGGRHGPPGPVSAAAGSLCRGRIARCPGCSWIQPGFRFHWYWHRCRRCRQRHRHHGPA